MRNTDKEQDNALAHIALSVQKSVMKNDTAVAPQPPYCLTSL
jgi:hypothetical protein